MSISHSTSPNFGEKSHFKITDRQQSLPGVEYLQGNNNCFEEEEEWQSKLDVWREKRRQALRTEATKFALLQERENRENERRKEEIKDRLRKAKSQRNLISSGHVSSLDLAPPPKINSPGVALLTGSDFDSLTFGHFEKNQMDAVSPSQSVSSNKFQHTESSDLFKSNDSETNSKAYSDCSSPVSELKTEVQSNITDKTMDVSSSSKNSVEKYANCNRIEVIRDLISEPDNCNVAVTPETKLSYDASSEDNDYSECKLRLSSRPGVSEVHWGLTVKARGPSNTSPFVVERVKIGSSADICEFQKGDILASIDGINLGIGRKNTNKNTSQVANLEDLENLMARLVLTNKPITVSVFRKMDEFDELNDGESDTGGDFSVESTAMKFKHTPSNISDSDSECHELLVSPVVKDSHKTSLVDTPVLQRPITITHSHHRSPSRSSIQISDDEVNNSSVSSNSEVKEYNCLKGNFNISSKSVGLIPKNENFPLFKSNEDKSKDGISNTMELEMSSNTPTPSDSANCNSTLYHKQNVEVTLTEPVSFSLVTASTLSPSIQMTHEIRPTVSILDNIKPTDFTHKKITRPERFAVNRSLRQEVTSVSNNFGDSSTSTPTFPNETTSHPSSLLKTRHLSKQRTFHIHPKLPETWDDIPSHISGIQCSFPSNYKENSVSNAPPQSYPLYSTDLCKSKQLDSFRPHVPPRPIPKTTRAASQFSGFTTIVESESRPSIFSSSNQTIPAKSDPSSDTTKNKFLRVSESDIYVNASNIHSSPQPAAPIPMAKTKQPPQGSLNDDKQSVTENFVNEYGLERSSVKYALNSSDEAERFPLPAPHQICENLEAKIPPIPPRTPRVRIIDINQLCAACNAKLDSEDSMVIESLNLYYHLPCFVCARCGIALGDGLSDVEVRVRRNLLYCSHCHSKNLTVSNNNKNECRPQMQSVQPSSQSLKPLKPTDKRHRNGPEQQLSSNLNKNTISQYCAL
ncbi:unnamed protein product [Schistosoma rodhaini]|uniref:LIM zinc-binding domain-containing protein n=1 Tax=Schistosoma rodhaini TaxID=6188 RepID=A0AA85G7D8_9TREM|nr:unnamed protein product [Schistosoma rodhaini]